MKINYPTCFGIVALAALLVTVPFVHGGRNNQQCISAEVLKQNAQDLRIDEPVLGQLYLNGRMLDTTGSCVKGLPKKIVEQLTQQLEAQGQLGQ